MNNASARRLRNSSFGISNLHIYSWLAQIFLWKFLYFSYHKIFPPTLQSYELLNEIWKTTADILQSDYLLLDFCDFAKKKKMANCFIRLRLKFSQEYYNDTFITIHDAVWIVCMLYDVGYIFLLVFPTGSYGITLVIDRLNAACLPCLVLCYLF